MTFPALVLDEAGYNLGGDSEKNFDKTTCFCSPTDGAWVYKTKKEEEVVKFTISRLIHLEQFKLCRRTKLKSLHS